MVTLQSLKTRLWEWGCLIPGEDIMQVVTPIGGRIQEEAKSDFIAQYGDRYEFVRIFKMTQTTFGIHFRKKSASSLTQESREN
jgi:hypothetical protein